MMDINADLLCCNKNCSVGSIARVDKYAIKSEIMTNQHPQDLGSDIQQKNYISQLLESLKNVRFTFLKTLFGIFN